LRITGNILGRQFFIFLEDTVDGKFRANDLTEIAIDAFPLFGDQRRMIAFFIEFRGFLEDLVGAEFYAKPATLTTVFNDMQFPDRYGMGSGIQRQSPEFHPVLLIKYTQKLYIYLKIDGVVNMNKKF
jgi:hypothetical protein